MKLLLRRNRSGRQSEEGWVLLTVLLTVSLMTIAALAVLPEFIFELKRDQELEMIHRGVQYTRAIRTYYKKFGRYPTRLEDLDNTNNLRFLRKHYKDPLTGKDFRLLHYGEPGLSIGGSLGGGLINGATPAGAAMNSSSNGSSFGNSFGGSSGSSFGGNSSFGGGGSGFGGGSSFGNSNGVNSSGVFSQSSSFGGSSSGGFGTNSNQQNNSGQQATNSNSTESASAEVASGTAQGDTSSEQQLVTSGPIVGVASTSKKTTIREYNKKKKYNEWQFIYDPTADRGGLITTPYQPPLQGMAGQSLQPSQNGSQSGSTNSSPFGNSGSSFGNSGSSFGNSGSSFGQSSSGFGQSGSSGFGNNSGGSSPPPSNPPQQQ